MLNRLHLDVDRAAFARKWQILKVLKDDGKWFGGSTILDKVSDVGVVSVSYAKTDDQNRAYLLVEAGQDNFKSVSRLFKADEDFSQFTIASVPLESVPDFILSNLLINASNAMLSSDEEGSVSHVTGSCYIMDSSMKRNPTHSKDGRLKQFEVVSLSVTPDMCLSAVAVTFSSFSVVKQYGHLKKNVLSMLPKYRLDGFSIQRVTEFHDPDTTYVRRNPFSSKASIPFMNAKVLETKSRIAIATRYLRIVNELFTPITSLSLTTVQGESASWSPRAVDFHSMFPSSRLSVVCSEDEADVGDALSASISGKRIEAERRDEPGPSAPSLVVLPHGRVWYEQHKHFSDPYKNLDCPDAAVQRIDADELRQAIEADEKNRQRDRVGNAVNSIVSTAILNAAIKQDIVEVVRGGQPSSMMPAFVPSEAGSFELSIPLVEKNEKGKSKPLSERFTSLVTMRFDLDGRIGFTIRDRDELYDTDEGELMADSLSYRTEGFVRYQGRTLIIEHTDMVPFPDWEGYRDFWTRVYEWSVPLNVILDYVPEAENRALWSSFVTAVKCHRNPTVVSRSWILKEVDATDEETAKSFGLTPGKYKKKIRSIAEKAVHEYDPSKRLRVTKDVSVRESYWNSLYGINWFRLDDHPDSLFWYAGIHSSAIGSNYILEKAPNVREVRSLDGPLPSVEWLVELCNVQFVRLKNVTVLPFPFKYLREYVRKYGTGAQPVDYEEDE